MFLFVLIVVMMYSFSRVDACIVYFASAAVIKDSRSSALARVKIQFCLTDHDSIRIISFGVYRLGYNCLQLAFDR